MNVSNGSPDLSTAKTVEPRCVHFGTCGGCQYQDISHDDQLRLKQSQLAAMLSEAGLQELPPIAVHASEPYGYRNRIRLRVERIDGELRLGYSIRTTAEFLPIVQCPIATSILWDTAVSLLQLAEEDRDAEFWLNATSEVELFCNDDLTRLQITLLCTPRTKVPQGALIRFFNVATKVVPQIASLTAIASDPRTGPTGRTLDAVGAAGLNYKVPVGDAVEETYWISRGGFFQVNRFLIGTLVDLVTTGRSGKLAWDLFAGVGLFSRVLARSFAQITAVEASPTAAKDLGAALAKLGRQHVAIEATTLDFLKRSVTQRERPELIVLDPPRAGAGVEACELLNRLAPGQIVYVSCDPTTLARDLFILQTKYAIAALHLVDLFPQTFHLETVAVLHRKP